MRDVLDMYEELFADVEDLTRSTEVRRPAGEPKKWFIVRGTGDGELVLECRLEA